MNKLTLVTLISSALSAGAMADDHKDKIAMTFAELDKNSDGYVTRDEVSGTPLAKHFDTMNLNGNDMLTRNEFNTHVSNNPSHFDGDVVASVQSNDNGVQEVDPKTVSAAGEDEIVLATESKANESASMTAKTNTDKMKGMDKDVSVDKDVDIDTDDDEVAMSQDIEKESSMTVKTESDNMGEKDINVEKDVDIESDTDEMAMTGDADMEKESTMTVKTEQDNMGGEKNVNIEKDVDVEMEAEAETIAATEFDEIDTDQDGKLTKAEIADAADKVKFHEIDINNDEMVSRAEYDSYKRTDVKSDMNDYDEE